MGNITKFTLIIVLISISACGWHLRGAQNQNAPENLRVIASDIYAPFILTLTEVMRLQSITNTNNAPLQLHIGKEALKKRTVAVTNIGSPSQYELSLSVDFHYQVANKTEILKLPKSISVHRVFDFDPSNTVAKSEEENTLLAEMRRELAHRILQQALKQTKQ